MSKPTREQLKKEIEERQKALAKLDQEEASTAFAQVMELLETFGQHFSKAQKKEISQVFGEVGKGKQKEKAPSGNKPKKYKIGDVEWSGQGGDGKAPQAFKEWREKNPNKPWPTNPAYQA